MCGEGNWKGRPLTNKVFISGGAGFIGAQLAAALVRENFEIDIVDNLSRGANDAALEALSANRKVSFHNIDLLTPHALDSFGRDYTFIIHLAGIVGVQHVVEQPYRTLTDNVFLHESVFALANRQRSLKRVLFTSTSEVYAGSLLHLDLPFPTPEDTPLALPPLKEPRTSYMLSKIYGEGMLMQSGLPYTIVRPHNVYGPRMGQDHVIPQLLEKAHRAPAGGLLEVFSPAHCRTFCFISDAVEMMKKLLTADAARGQTVNLGAESPEYSIRRLAEIVIATVGKPLSILEGPATQGSPIRRAPKMSRMLELTGCAARTPLAEGVQRTYDWYRSNVFA